MRDCRNRNPIFENFSPDTKEHRTELAKQIRNIGAENLSYWHGEYLKKDGIEYIVVDVEGKDLCAKAEIQVSDWGKISGMRREISGYKGAQLVGLDFDIIEEPTGLRFVLKDIDVVID